MTNDLIFLKTPKSSFKAIFDLYLGIFFNTWNFAKAQALFFFSRQKISLFRRFNLEIQQILESRD